MELKTEEIKATVMRLQGQLDVWQALYTAAVKEDQKPIKTPSNETNKE